MKKDLVTSSSDRELIFLTGLDDAHTYFRLNWAMLPWQCEQREICFKVYKIRIDLFQPLPPPAYLQLKTKAWCIEQILKCGETSEWEDNLK